MDPLAGTNLNFNGSLNFQFGGSLGISQFPAPPVYASPNLFQPQMLTQVLTQMMSVLAQLQSQWSSFLAPPFGAVQPQAYQAPPQAYNPSPPSLGFEGSFALALSLSVQQQGQSYAAPQPEPKPAPQAAVAIAVNQEQPRKDVAVAISAHQEAPAPEAAVAVSFSGGDGGDGGGGDGGDPIILDLNGDNQLDVTGKDGKKIDFNLFGNGTPVKTEWLKAGTQDGLLVSDFNGDGKIDSGRELMRTTGVNGEQAKYKGGWDKLSQLFDQNGDGRISGQELDKLQVWVDRDGDGVSEDGELQSVKNLGVSQIDVPTEGVRSTFTMNGKQQLAEDYVFDLEDS